MRFVLAGLRAVLRKPNLISTLIVAVGAIGTLVVGAQIVGGTNTPMQPAVAADEAAAPFDICPLAGKDSSQPGLLVADVCVPVPDGPLVGITGPNLGGPAWGPEGPTMGIHSDDSRDASFVLFNKKGIIETKIRPEDESDFGPSLAALGEVGDQR